MGWMIPSCGAVTGLVGWSNRLPVRHNPTLPLVKWKLCSPHTHSNVLWVIWLELSSHASTMLPLENWAGHSVHWAWTAQRLKWGYHSPHSGVSSQMAATCAWKLLSFRKSCGRIHQIHTVRWRSTLFLPCPRDPLIFLSAGVSLPAAQGKTRYLGLLYAHHGLDALQRGSQFWSFRQPNTEEIWSWMKTHNAKNSGVLLTWSPLALIVSIIWGAD